MADTKISALTAATTPLAGTEVLPIVQSGVTKKVTVADLTAGRAVTAGTLVVGPNAKQSNNSFEVNADTSYAGFVQNTGYGVGGTPINPVLNYGLYIGCNRSNGNAEANLIWGSGIGALSDLVVAQWTGTTYSVHTTFKKGGELNIANGNLEIGTAGKGITTGGSFALGFGTNGSTSQGTLDTSGNLAVTGYVKGTTFAASGQQALSGSGTVNTTTFLVTLYSLSGTATLTLPSSPVVGQIIRVRSQSAQAVNSASNNITSLASGAVTNSILPATAGKWADLWWDGSYWNIIAAN